MGTKCVKLKADLLSYCCEKDFGTQIVQLKITNIIYINYRNETYLLVYHELICPFRLFQW